MDDVFAPVLELFDSGYTDAELDALFTELAQGVAFTWPDQALALAMAIGLTDGDVTELSDAGTVLLSTPRAELDRRIASVRAARATGQSLAEAVQAL